eukprot:497181-Prymnesium_polylepis.1
MLHTGEACFTLGAGARGSFSGRLRSYQHLPYLIVLPAAVLPASCQLSCQRPASVLPAIS